MKHNIFITLLLLFNTLFIGASNTDEEILRLLNLNSDLTETVKGISPEFASQLTQKGEPLIYNKENSNNFEYIGMPVGGITAGQLYLGGDGKLWFWDIFNTNYDFDLKGEGAYRNPYKRSEKDGKGIINIEQGFAIQVIQNNDTVTRVLDRDGIENIEFLGQYPIGEVWYKDAALPVDIHLEAFSPFEPLNVDNSSYPATIFNFKVKNTSSNTIKVNLAGWLENAVCVETHKSLEGKWKNEIKSDSNGAIHLLNSASLSINPEDKPKDNYDYGTMSLSLLNANNDASGNTAIDISQLSKDIFKSYSSAIESNFNDSKLIGALNKTLTLEPGQEANVDYIFSWHFKNSRALLKLGEMKNKHYNKRFKSAEEVSAHLVKNFDELCNTTRTWRYTWYNSTLPYWFLDRTFLNTSILASGTSHLFDDDVFYGFEGAYQGTGTCTHVWSYVQAMGRLFPDLEKSLREKTDFVPTPAGGLRPDGSVNFRGRYGNGLAVDGQSGIIIKSYLCHLMSKDNTFLNNNYEGIKTVMNGLIELRDADHDGILTGAQHNTLDADWYGKVTWLSLIYDAALEAMAEMAEEANDLDYAKMCRETSMKGRQYIDENLFNGDYYFHEGDPNHQTSPGVYTGCEYSQLYGQSWSNQLGLGVLLNEKQIETALQSIWKYNFATDVGPFREVHRAGRWYAMPGEGGVIACTWPFGGSEVLTLGNPRYAAYNNECQNGYEYAYTSTLMYHGMPELSMAHIWYMHNNRYHGAVRNPWCEVEWGTHYARSMASYGHFVGVSGFKHHGPKGHITFAPKITKDNFKSAFVTSEGWGTFTQTEANNTQEESLEMVHGKLRVNQLTFTLNDGLLLEGIELKNGANTLEANYEVINGSEVVITLDEELILNKGEKLSVKLNCTTAGANTAYTEVTIPGKFEAENFNLGGDGVAYYDAEQSNTGNQYRTDEGVDIIAYDNGYAVTGIQANEWLNYTFDVEKEGVYTIELNAKSTEGKGKVQLFKDEMQELGYIEIEKSESYSSTAPKELILKTGKHTLKLKIIEGGFELDYINFVFEKDNMPFPWLNAKIGEGQGAAIYESEGNFKLSTSNGKLLPTGDQINFICQTTNDNTSISGTIDSLECGISGFMFRESLEADSRFIMLYKEDDNTIALCARSKTADDTLLYSFDLPQIDATTKLKLSREGNNYSAHYDNGNGFKPIAEFYIKLGSTPYVGMTALGCDANATDFNKVQVLKILPIEEKEYVTITKGNAQDFAIDGNNGGANGQNVYLWSFAAGNANQQWIEEDVGGGYIALKKNKTNFALDADNGGKNGQNVYLWSFSKNNQNQHWKKVQMSDGTYRLQKRNAEGFSIASGDGGANGQNIYLMANDDQDANQHWVFDNTLHVVSIDTIPVSPTPVEGVKFTTDTIKIIENEEMLLEVDVLPSGADNPSINWHSTNKGIVEVDANGTIDAKLEGEAYIIAESQENGMRDSCFIIVSAIHLEAMTLDIHDVDATSNNFVYFNPVFTPTNAKDKSITWESSDSTVLQSYGEGIFYALKQGIVMVKATANDGGFTDSCAVRVDGGAAKITSTYYNQGIKLSPNPAFESLSIELDETIRNTTNLNIYNSLGQLILSKPMENSSVKIDIKEHPDGLYFVEISNDTIIYTSKFIKVS